MLPAAQLLMLVLSVLQFGLLSDLGCRLEELLTQEHPSDSISLFVRLCAQPSSGGEQWPPIGPQFAAAVRKSQLAAVSFLSLKKEREKRPPGERNKVTAGKHPNRLQTIYEKKKATKTSGVEVMFPKCAFEKEVTE